MSNVITLQHSVEELNTILSALSDRPFKEVAGLLMKIKSEAETQLLPTGQLVQNNDVPTTEGT